MGRPAKQKAYWEAKKAEEGRLAAQRADENKRGIFEKLQPYIENVTKHLDVMEVGAILGATFLIHETLIGLGPALKGSAIGGLVTEVTAVGKGDLSQTAPAKLWDEIVALTKGDFSKTAFGFLFPKTEKDANAIEAGTSPVFSVDLTLWLISYTLAFFLIRHGGQILSSVSSLGGWLTSFVGGVKA